MGWEKRSEENAAKFADERQVMVLLLGRTVVGGRVFEWREARLYFAVFAL
jgi:hypothetical protein